MVNSLVTGLVTSLALAWAMPAIAAGAEERPSAKPPPDLFAMPGLIGEQHALEQLLRNGAYRRAETLIRQRLRDNPASARLHFLLAAALAGQKHADAALQSLQKSASLGLPPDYVQRKATIFSVLAADPRYRTLIARIGNPPGGSGSPPPAAPPATVSEQTATVSAANTVWDGNRETLRTYFRFAPDADGSAPVQTVQDRAAARLNQLYAAGKAAGNRGDLYDNRDNDHSTLKREDLPQLAFVEYGDAPRASRIHIGLNPGLLYNAVTFGNSSMAVTGGPFWRSQPRLALTRPGGGERFYRQYASNHLYIFPEHRDHDSEHGDVIPANTPYVLIAQGSSGSDKPLMRAVASILAAFQPAVKTFLQNNNLVMPTVQMIFRRGQSGMASDGAYLSGAAHPAVFESRQINLLQMIDHANGLKAEDVPPMVRLSVTGETGLRPGINLFGSQDEKLFDTPGAIARIVRSTDYAHKLTVSAAQTTDPNGRELSFHWVVLRGDARRIDMKLTGEGNPIAELTIPWHERMPVPGNPKLFSNRVDIGVFAHNGVHYSAPAFISLYYPANQWREYEADGRIRFIDYHASNYRTRYADPALFPQRDWSDRYEYDSQGRLTGWVRERVAGKSRFTRHGGRVAELDALKRPLRALEIRYSLNTGIGGLRHVVEHTTGRILTYRYLDDDDRLGQVVVTKQAN